MDSEMGSTTATNCPQCSRLLINDEKCNCNAPKSPLGVQPRRFWLEGRAKELSRAIYEYVSGGFIGGELAVTVLEWSRELENIMGEIQRQEAMKRI